jgi:hypothetical protein
MKSKYEAPSFELFTFMMEAGFAISSVLKGDSDGKGLQTQTSNIGQYQDGVDWSNNNDWSSSN